MVCVYFTYFTYFTLCLLQLRAAQALLRSRKPPGFSSADNGALHVALVNILELEGSEHVTWLTNREVEIFQSGWVESSASLNRH